MLRLPSTLRIDRRLLGLLGIGALIVLGELALRAWDAQQQLDRQLAQTRGRAAVLTSGSEQVDWAARTRAASDERDGLRARLWQAPTEAQAQARLRDWLTSALRSAEVTRPTVNLLPPLPATAGTPASAAASPPLRVRASVGFELAPGAMEKALAQIEGGGQLARVDSLSASARSRRVEMTVSVPVSLGPEAK